MSPLKFTTTFLCFILLYSLLQTDSEASSLTYYCTTDGNFTSNDSFDMNSKELLGYLNYEIGNDQRDFTLDSKGHGPAQVHGIAQCNYGVSAADYKSYIDDAGNEILKTCPYSREVIMLYDNCLLQYSNWGFFGKVEDYQLRVGFCSKQNVSQPAAAAAFDGARTQLLNSTAAEIIRTARMLATGELQVDGSTRLYALAQCRRDLLNFDCGKCLDGAVSKIQFCAGKQGGRVLAESCSIRYEVYKFYP